jgi:putative oxidoreductase
MLSVKSETAEAAGLLVLRLAIGGMILTHGWPKFQRLLETPGQFADPIGLGPEITLGLAVFAELVCAVMIVLGAWTRWVSVPLLATMLVAVLIVHSEDPFQKRELALLYGSGALTLILTGGGRFSVDGMRARKRQG